MTIEIICEAGINHNGDYHTACKLVDATVAAGADTFKTQLFNVERVYPRERWDEMKQYELTRHEIKSLKKYCDSKGIEFLCTPDEIEDALFLKSIGVKRIKTSSQDITNLRLLESIVALGLPMIVSTGACTHEELFNAIWSLDDSPNITLLHCVSAYPAPLAEMNLKVITDISSWRRMQPAWRYGLSDHTDTITASLVALGLGATVFEKHLTLTPLMPGPDQAASLTPPKWLTMLRRCVMETWR